MDKGCRIISGRRRRRDEGLEGQIGRVRSIVLSILAVQILLLGECWRSTYHLLGSTVVEERGLIIIVATVGIVDITTPSIGTTDPYSELLYSNKPGHSLARSIEEERKRKYREHLELICSEGT